MESTKDIVKALQEIAKAVENNEAVESIKVIITVKKQKPRKASNAFNGRDGAKAPSRKSIIPLLPAEVKWAIKNSRADGIFSAEWRER